MDKILMLDYIFISSGDIEEKDKTWLDKIKVKSLESIDVMDYDQQRSGQIFVQYEN